MRKKIVAGNWKMNQSPEEAEKLYNDLLVHNDWPTTVQVQIFPPIVYLQKFAEIEDPRILVGVQNFFPKDKGAFTGEVSIQQVVDCGAKSLLIGHSERRAYFGEHAEFLKEKVDAALGKRMHIIFCCGEPLDVRKEGKEMEFVKEQLEQSLFHLTTEEMLFVTIAYEPVWAIGTGQTATSAQAEDMHAAIRDWVRQKYDLELANKISILYGGSCSPENAKELFACPNVDGGLIGGASLKAESFLQIINSF
jgi:triosephosphate isomerase